MRIIYKTLPFYREDDGRTFAEGPFEESVVETAGYMTAQQQVQRLLAAGKLSDAWRKAHFPPDTDIPDDFVPPDYAPTELEILDEARMVVAGKTRAQARKEISEREKETVEAPEAPQATDSAQPEPAA